MMVFAHFELGLMPIGHLCSSRRTAECASLMGKFRPWSASEKHGIRSGISGVLRR